VLVPQKVTKEEDTQPSRPSAPLRCSAKWASIETRPSGLHNPQATAELEQPMADYSHFVSATQRDGMGFISLNSHCRNLNGSKKQIGLLKALMVALIRCSGSPSAAPSNAGLAGVFGHRLSEFRNKLRSVWLVRASFDGRPTSRVAQGTSGSWGALSFGYLFFVQAKKSNSPTGEKRCHPSPQNKKSEE